jgi:hypothetical protein
MKMRLLSLVVLVGFIKAEESFISDKEYGAMLFANPRGIPCKNCHNKNLQDNVIAVYKKRKKRTRVIIPQIKNITFEKLKKALKGRSIMPTYYLTNEEIRALVAYLK